MIRHIPSIWKVFSQLQPLAAMSTSVWHSARLVSSHTPRVKLTGVWHTVRLHNFPSRQYSTTDTLSSNEDATSDPTNDQEQSNAVEDHIQEHTQDDHTADDRTHMHTQTDHLDYDLDKLLENIRKAQHSMEATHVAASTTLTRTSPMNIEEIIEFLKQEGAEDVCVISVPPERDYVKYFVTCVGVGGRHIQRMADSLAAEYKRVKNESGKRLRATVEGRDSEDWVVVSLVDTVVHVMTEEARELYQLEQLWTLGRRYDNQYQTMERVNLESDALK